MSEVIYVIEGVVERGRELGRRLGFPTVNVALHGDDKLSCGVYKSSVTINGVLYRAVTNIGVNPTVGVVKQRSESYIIDFQGDLYGQLIKIELIEKLRDEQCFASVDALREQIAQDVLMATRSNQ